ncbi:metallophosphoesterase [Bacillus horti]|uniref:MPP superfamily phosphohydrolase n=1 Tax=Caldalkalibacillus horti TaxID=77523 RepID=A0ABT9W4J1_9BACI|nr:metallophosphoesterase [Bacillus horti]MDQ0168158.1 putative MPP superfamily phosphohydrolase [Bacillus horti]
MFTFIMIGLSICLLGLGLIYVMYKKAKNLKLRQQEITVDGWPQGFDGVNFLFISDLHREVISEEMKEKLKGLAIDVVLIGGDLTEKGASLDVVKQHVQFFTSLAPTYFVWGNHDYEADDRELDLLLQLSGVHILDNRAISFEAGEDRLWLLGVDDLSRNRAQLHYALLDIEQSPGFRIVLAHDPKIVLSIEKEHQIGLVFSGHTHGGQIRIPFIGSKIFGAFYSKYSAGFYPFKEKGLTLFISQGAGTSHIPLRLGTESELHLFTIRSK